MDLLTPSVSEVVEESNRLLAAYPLATGQGGYLAGKSVTILCAPSRTHGGRWNLPLTVFPLSEGVLSYSLEGIGIVLRDEAGDAIYGTLDRLGRLLLRDVPEGTYQTRMLPPFPAVGRAMAPTAAPQLASSEVAPGPRYLVPVILPEVSGLDGGRPPRRFRTADGRLAAELTTDALEFEHAPTGPDMTYVAAYCFGSTSADWADVRFAALGPHDGDRRTGGTRLLSAKAAQGLLLPTGPWPLAAVSQCSEDVIMQCVTDSTNPEAWEALLTGWNAWLQLPLMTCVAIETALHRIEERAAVVHQIGALPKQASRDAAGVAEAGTVAQPPEPARSRDVEPRAHAPSLRGRRQPLRDAILALFSKEQQFRLVYLRGEQRSERATVIVHNPDLPLNGYAESYQMVISPCDTDGTYEVEFRFERLPSSADVARLRVELVSGDQLYSEDTDVFACARFGDLIWTYAELLAASIATTPLGSDPSSPEGM